MRKYTNTTLFIVLLHLIPVLIFSQYRFGVQGGAGVSNYVGSDYSSDNDSKFGPSAGIFFEREVNLTLCLGFELNYEEKGTFYKDYPREGTTVSVDSRLKYIGLPVFAKLYFGKKADFFLYIGLAGQYLLSGENTVNATEYGYIIDSEPFFPYTFRNYDATVSGGGGFNIGKMSVDIKYHHGLINVYDGKNVPSIRNSFITATLGLTLYKKNVINCFNNRAY